MGSLELQTQILGLLYTAPTRFSGLQAAGRCWYRPMELAEAHQAWLATQEPGTVASIVPQSPVRRTKRTSTSCVQTNVLLRVVTSPRGELKVDVVDPRDGTVTAGGFPYKPMLRPQGLIPHIKINSIREVTVGDREALELQAEPRRHNIEFGGHPLGNIADVFDLTVDKELGIRLSHVSLHRGRAFLGEQLCQIKFAGATLRLDSRLGGIADIIRLLYGARDSFSTLRASIREWYRYREGTDMHSRANTKGSTPEVEIRSRMWVDNPSRFRKDIETPSLTRGIGYLISDDIWWERYSSGVAVTNSPREQIPGGAEVRLLSRPVRSYYEDSEYAIISQIPIDPSRLISGLRMEPVGPVEYAGREAIRVQAEPVEEDSSGWYWWEGADMFELLIDSERGTLMRIEALRHGEGFAGIELTDVEFDVPIPDDVFTFTPSPGAIVEVSPPVVW